MELLDYLKKELTALSGIYVKDARGYMQQGEEDYAEIQYELGRLLNLFVAILVKYKSQEENRHTLNPVD